MLPVPGNVKKGEDCVIDLFMRLARQFRMGVVDLFDISDFKHYD